MPPIVCRQWRYWACWWPHGDPLPRVWQSLQWTTWAYYLITIFVPAFVDTNRMAVCWDVGSTRDLAKLISVLLTDSSRQEAGRCQVILCGLPHAQHKGNQRQVLHSSVECGLPHAQHKDNQRQVLHSSVEELLTSWRCEVLHQTQDVFPLSPSAHAPRQHREDYVPHLLGPLSTWSCHSSRQMHPRHSKHWWMTSFSILPPVCACIFQWYILIFSPSWSKHIL